jgi:2-iminobutanoate/2-iminopropanoate deaminase
VRLPQPPGWDELTRTRTAAPAAIGPYSQAVAVGDTLYVSGCIPLDPASMAVVGGGIDAQAAQALANLKAVVEGAGSELGKVAKTTVRTGRPSLRCVCC